LHLLGCALSFEPHCQPFCRSISFSDRVSHICLGGLYALQSS
jgi:hypothetical protein